MKGIINNWSKRCIKKAPELRGCVPCCFTTVVRLWNTRFLFTFNDGPPKRMLSNYKFKQFRLYSSTPYRTAQSNETHFTGISDRSAKSSIRIDANSSPSIQSIPTRSKKLASIIRDGAVLLNQTSSTIQNNTETNKSIFSVPEVHSEPDARQLAEEHRIFVTAQKCLDDLCTKDPSFPLMAGDEPILILGVRVKPSFTHADLYWSLPYCVLTAKELNERQREFLTEKMTERLNGAPGGMLLQRINTVLSSYYPPKIRYKVAPPLLVHQLIYDFEEE
jgi:hypothetical protein